MEFFIGLSLVAFGVAILSVFEPPWSPWPINKFWSGATLVIGAEFIIAGAVFLWSAIT